MQRAGQPPYLHGGAPRQRLPRTRMVRIKVISLGDCGVGKSCLIKRYCEGKFVSRYIPTIGVDYGVKPIRLGDFEVRVNLWDMAGPDEYAEVRNEFYRDSQGALLVFDVGSRASFEALDGWLQEARRFGAPADMEVCVAGTKAEGSPATRRVPEAEARAWAAARGLRYFEVSALTGAGVDALFATLFAEVLAGAGCMPRDAVELLGRQAVTGGGGGGSTASDGRRDDEGAADGYGAAIDGGGVGDGGGLLAAGVGRLAGVVAGAGGRG